MDQHPLLHAANILERVVEQIEHAASLDPAADRVRDAVALAIPNGPRKDLLSGTWLGHPLHPMLTDLPIGFWTSAFVLDIVGGKTLAPGGRAPRRARCVERAADRGERRGGLVRHRRPLAPCRVRPRRREHVGNGVVRVVVERAPPESARARRRARLPRGHRCHRRRLSWRPSVRASWHRRGPHRASTPARPTGRQPLKKPASQRMHAGSTLTASPCSSSVATTASSQWPRPAHTGARRSKRAPSMPTR